jgi:small subunit ribosomal protein S13
VRVAGVILDGGKEVSRALTDIKGVGIRLSHVVARKLGYPKDTKLGTLTEKDIEKIEATLTGIHKIASPWMLNRKRDYQTGESSHLIGADLEFSQREDITKQKRIKSYRGVRHALGQPVRGQRTRSTFRTGSTIGVVRKKVVAAQATQQKKQ